MNETVRKYYDDNYKVEWNRFTSLYIKIENLSFEGRVYGNTIYIK